MERSELPFAYVKTSLYAKPFIWKCVSPKVHFHANLKTHFHMKGFARGLAFSETERAQGNPEMA